MKEIEVSPEGLSPEELIYLFEGFLDLFNEHKLQILMTTRIDDITGKNLLELTLEALEKLYGTPQPDPNQLPLDIDD